MAHKLNVLHVVGGFPTPGRPHFQMFIKTQVDSLIAAGINCDVMVLQGQGPRKYIFGRRQVRQTAGIKKYDLIHAHYSYCGWACLSLNRPLVTSFLGSDLYGHPKPDGSFPRWMKQLHILLARHVAKHSTQCIVKSQAMLNDLDRDAHVVPNGVDCRLFKAIPPEDRSTQRVDLGLKEDTRYILFAGDPKLPRKRYSLARDSVAEANRLTQSPLELLPLHGQTHETVIRHMQACDMLILTSSLEGSPNVVKEAMATNLPVVAVQVGDTRERLDGVSGCRVTSDDHPETIGAAIAEVFRRNEPCQSRDAVISLDMPRVAEKIKWIYETALRK